MTCTILLVRHAAHDGLGDRLTGRTPGVSLGKIGRDQAQRLSKRIRSVRPARIIASPQPRTQETAHALASACGLPAVQTDGRLDEIDFGDTWTNRTWDELDQDPAWRTWNEQRATARTPGGETMAAVQARIVVSVEAARHEGKAGDTIVMVTHADLIKAAVCHVLNLSIGQLHRFDVDPASTTGLAWGDWGAKLLWLNERIDTHPSA